MKTFHFAALILFFLAAGPVLASGAERDSWKGSLPPEDFQIRAVSLTAGQSLTLELKGDGTSRLDLMVVVRTAGGKLERVAATKGPGDRKSLRLVAAQTGNHFIYVANSGDRTSNFELQVVRQ